MLACIALCVVLTIALDHGIQVARENHAGLMPVVRRLLDPAYLPGDFGIELRLHHHRVFAWMVAWLAAPLGEARAFAVLTVAGYALMFAAVWELATALRLDVARRVLLCVALASGAAFLDHGVEANRLLGNGPIMPPTFAHAFLVLATAALVRRAFTLAFVCGGLALLVHLQIGAIGMAMLLVATVALGAWRRPRAWLPGLMIGVALALPALADLWALSQQGLAQGIGQTRDVAFRMPQHFEFHGNRVAAVLAYLVALIVLVRRWHRRGDTRAALFAPVLVVACTLAAFSAIHYFDYYLLRTGGIARIQLLRLSLLIPLLSACALLAAIPVRAPARHARQQRAMLAVAAVFAVGACANAVAKDDALTLRIVDQSRARNDWADVCRWIRMHGPRALYVTPPGQTGFAAFADRSTLVEFKINPDGGAGLREWQARLSRLAGGTLPVTGSRTDTARALDAAYAMRTPADFAALKTRYGVTHAVVPVSTPSFGTVLHANAGYRVVALP